MKILKNFILFWIPTIIVLLLSIFSTRTTDNIEKIIIPTWNILQRNITVLLIIWLSGFFNKYVPYWIFGLNSLFFSIILAISGNVMHIVDVMKYGILEVLAFSTVLSISGKIKTKYLITAIILIIAAAFLENLVMRGVL